MRCYPRILNISEHGPKYVEIENVFVKGGLETKPPEALRYFVFIKTEF